MDTLEPLGLLQTQNLFYSQTKLQNFLQESSQNSTVCIDLSEIRRQYEYWKQELPGIEAYYAVKCNPNPKIVEFLAKIGSHFDCASQGEMDLCRRLGVPGEKIIFANPIKGESHIHYARENSVEKMTFDSIEEYRKIISIYPHAKPIIRIAVDDSQSVCKFNSKFGAFPEQVSAFFKEIQEGKGNVYGVSFHVGSGCRDPKIHRDAITKAVATIREGKSYGFDMNILDIGGGYPSNDRYICFRDIAKNIREVRQELQEKYPELKNVSWIGEPGRYMVGCSHTMITEIIGVKKQYHDNLRIYINEGVYGSLSGIIFDYADPLLSVYNKEYEKHQHEYTIFGPTCDSLDRIGNVFLPEVGAGDKIIFWNIGDYSVASATTFNGFQLPNLVYYISRESERTFTSKLSFPVL